MSTPYGEIDLVIIEDPIYEVIEVTDAPAGPKGDTGSQGPAGPSLPIVLYRRGVLSVVDGRMKYRYPFAATLVGISAAMGVGTPPVGSPITVDLLVNGVVAYTLTIPDGAEDVPEVAVSIPIAVGDFLTANITSVGSTSPGEDMTIIIRYEV